MSKEKDDQDKIIRIPGETLVVKLTPDEIRYREKYLPDPTSISDEKLVCTVCSVLLAEDVHKGKDIFVHIALHVLVCQDCYDFYGNGCFSVDEDGDDKYCRWCGQGGTLFICSACTCGFCSRCMKKNLKTSALAEVERDDWKCFICLPRPIFGVRAICWAAQSITENTKEHIKLKIQMDTLEPNGKKCEETMFYKTLHNEDDMSTKKRKHKIEDYDISDVNPCKIQKTKAESTKGLNGILENHTKEYDTSDYETSVKITSKSVKNTRKKGHCTFSSSSSEEIERENKKHQKFKKKAKSKHSSEDSSVDAFVTLRKKVYSKKRERLKVTNHEKYKKRQQLPKGRGENMSDSSSSNMSTNERKTKHKKKNRNISDTELSEESMKESKEKKNQLSSSGDSDNESHDSKIRNDNRANDVNCNEPIEITEGKDIDSESNLQLLKDNKVMAVEIAEEIDNSKTKSEIVRSTSDLEINSPKIELEISSSKIESMISVLEEEIGIKKIQDEPEIHPELGDMYVRDENVEKKIKLATGWLNGVVDNISELGSLIAIHANKFSERKLNIDNINSYEDVIVTLNKLKQLISSVHMNYKNIECELDIKLTTWKEQVGLKDPESCGAFADKEPLPGNDSAEGISQDEFQNLSNFAQENYDKNNLSPKNSSDMLPDNEGRCDEVEKIAGNKEVAPDDEEKIVQEDIIKNNVEIVLKGIEIYSEAALEPKDKELKAVLYHLKNEEIDKETTEGPNLKNSTLLLGCRWPGLSIDDDSDLDINTKFPTASNTTPVTDNDQSNDILVHNKGPEDISDDKKKEQHEIVKNSGKLNVENHNQCLPSIEKKDVELEESSVNKNIVQDTEGFMTQKEFNKISVDEGELDSCDTKNEMCHPNLEDSLNNEALQLMLYSSSDEDVKSSESDSDDSDEIVLDDSDLDLKKPLRCISKKRVGQKKRNESKVQNNITIEGEEEDKGTKRETRKVDEAFDSEAEIDMLTDLTKLKKKTTRRLFAKENSEEESEYEDSSEDGNEDQIEELKKRRKYKNESKKRREEERNELLGFLERNSSNEDEGDITRRDLDVLEDKYASSSSESMTLEAFSQKMNAKWKELEQQQEEMNLQMLLASESEEGSIGGDDIILETEDQRKKKTAKKIKEEKDKEGEHDKKENLEDAEVKIEEEKYVDEVDNSQDVNVNIEQDEEYEQFLEGMSKVRTTFKGLGSSTEGSERDSDHDDTDMEIKEEPLSDDVKIKNEPKDSDVSHESSDSDASSNYLIMELSKKKSLKKKSWRSHRLLRIKLSDTDTSDEERWWQRRLEKEQSKKDDQGDSDSSEFDEFAQSLTRSKKTRTLKKKDNSSDKENKKEVKKEEENGSSTLELSSTESSGSLVFKKKTRKKEESSDSDVINISDDDKRKKKKKKKGSGSSDESDDSGDSMIDISQKSKQGESPGKGGRKNIRKVMTKHELAAATKAAAKEEEERKKRIAARQKLFNEMFEIKEAEVLQKLVLDFDPETKTELISVDNDLVIKMKPHQAKGVKFMWDSCFESLSQLKTKKGSGCILAHCMGLGKTFQVISLVHTILKHKDTNVKTVLVVCPLSTVLNWYGEFHKWLDDVAGGHDIKIFHLTKFKRPHERSRQLSQWQQEGGVMILGYELFRILANENCKKFRLNHREIFQKTLIDPGADLVVCDEGHMLKNESTALSKAMSRIRTLRRIVLTGTPMQNNLKEYHCMVQFVKPNLLGTRKEFLNQFVNPITNGQFVDSTESDVKVMKRRAHVLHKMLEGLVQRFDYTVLTPFLPPKHEYVVSLRLSEVQVRLYQFYLENFNPGSNKTRTGSQLFQDWQALGRIWTHPRVLKMCTDKAVKEREKQRSEEESLKDFIDDKSSLSLSSSSNSSSSDDDEKVKTIEKNPEKEPVKEEVLVPSQLIEQKTAKESIKEEVPSELIEAEINLISSEDDEAYNKELKEKEDEENNIIEDINKEGDGNKQNKRKNGDKMGDDVNNSDHNQSHCEKNSTVEYKNVELDDSKNKEKSNKEEKNEKEKLDAASNKIEKKEMDSRGGWWKEIIEPEHLDDINQSAKLVVLFAILRECELIEDKVLVFSQSLYSLDLIEYFLEKIDKATEENRLEESLGNHAGCWTKGLDYFRLDGSSSSENRSAWCKTFNREDNSRARLFLISTRAGGLGINLTAANRVVIFDASWNPSHDVQSIFRIYRFGQKKPCYVYRFIASGTMEEKVYDRQVAKQSLSSRVVDEQQVHRHFSMNDLNELYTFTPPGTEQRTTPALPKDRLMAELLTQYSNWIEKYHEHDSLLENVLEEELNEEERKLAWEDYENDKKRSFIPATGTGSAASNVYTANQVEFFRKSLRLKYPSATEQDMNAMLQTLMHQINSMTASRSNQQFMQQPQQAQQNTGTFQTVGSPNIRMPSNANLTPAQMFNMQRNHLYKKYGQQIQTKQNQRMGNVHIKHSQSVGNVLTKVGSGGYEDEMRRQQEANLARLQNQRKLQQSQMQKQVLPTQTRALSQQLNSIYQPQNRHVQNRQQPVQNRQPVQIRHPVQNRQLIHNRQPQGLRNPQVVSNWKHPQSQQQGNLNTNRVQGNSNQIQKQPTVSQLLNNRQLQIMPVKNPIQTMQKPAPLIQKSIHAVQKPNQLLKKTQQQLQQEEMRRRITALQQQKQMTLQQKLHHKTQANSVTDAINKKKLEEMKKRYKASRNNQPTDIVEIDDEPSRPSGSSV